MFFNFKIISSKTKLENMIEDNIKIINDNKNNQKLNQEDMPEPNKNKNKNENENSQNQKFTKEGKNNNIFFKMSIKYINKEIKAFEKLKEIQFNKLNEKKATKLSTLQKNKKNDLKNWDNKDKFIMQTYIYAKYLDPRISNYEKELIEYLNITIHSDAMMVDVLMTILVLFFGIINNVCKY